MTKKLLSILLVLAMVLGLTACGTPADESTESKTDSAVVEPTGDGDSDTMFSTGGPQEFFEAPWLNPGTYTYTKTLYDRLLVADDQLLPAGGQMAESYELSEDGSVLTFVLREGVKWHDGENITTQDIKWSIEYSLLTTVCNSVFRQTFLAIEGADAYMAGDAEEISGIVVDDTTITITFASVASNALLAFTQFAPLPQKYFVDVDPLQFQQAAYFQNPVGSGPFRTETVEMNDYTILAPFEEYWGGTADFNIHLIPGPGDSDPNLVVNAQAGKVDYGYTKDITTANTISEMEGMNVDRIDVRYVRFFYTNKFPSADGTPSPLEDQRVRQAIRYAIDMESIATEVFGGAATPANSLTPDAKVEGLNNYDFNPEKAKELLAEANWDPNTELDVVFYYTDQQTVDLMTIIQAMLSEVGVKMSFNLVEGDLASILWQTPEDKLNGPSAVDWDMCYGAVAALSLSEIYDRYSTGDPINSHTPTDAKLDELIAATHASMDAEVTQQAFFDLQEYENENMFSIPLYYQPIFLVTSDKLVEANIDGNPQYTYNWDIQNWKLG